MQVLLNILGNALRFTEPGGEVILSVCQVGNNIVFSIKDNGAGIATEDLNNIFERFYKADQSRTRSDGGTGLGLAISKGIVEAHGGQISVHSIIGEGSVFTFTLPLPGDTV